MLSISPLCHTWLRTVMLPGAGVLALFLGQRIGRLSSRRKTALSVAAAIVAIVAVATHYPPLRPILGPAAASVGEESSVAGYALLLLVAVARAKSRSGILCIGAGLAFVIILMLALPPLYLHYFDRRLYSNYADKDGFIQQTTGFTCAAASASMLLKHYGFRASEGLIAEEAGTNPLTGTNEFSLARALDNVIASHGYKAAAGCLTYHQAVEMHSPFEAYIVRPPIGGHAILVTSLGLDGVAISDPLIMGSDKMTVAEFKNQWTGTAIWISAQK